MVWRWLQVRSGTDPTPTQRPETSKSSWFPELKGRSFWETIAAEDPKENIIGNQKQRFVDRSALLELEFQRV